MNNTVKNILLLAVVLVLSYFTAVYFGALYDLLVPSQVDTIWIGTTRSWQFIIGLPFSYIFFLTLFIETFGSGNKRKWMWWLLVPGMIFFAIGGIKYIYPPIVMGLIAFGLATLFRKMFKDNKFLQS